MEESDLDESLRALSHRDRRRFIQACLDRELAAGDLAALSNLSLATVSEHLKVLRKARLLILNREGRFWLYRTDKVRLTALTEDIAKLGPADGP